MPAVIVENDESQWRDETGVLYHFPRRYEQILTPGEQLLYYKGRMRDRSYAAQRLSPEPHYFGVGRVGRVFDDPHSHKGDRFAMVEGFEAFSAPVPIRDGTGDTYETIPESRQTNYWRDGVRPVSLTVFERIVNAANITPAAERNHLDPSWPTAELQSGIEGGSKVIYTTVTSGIRVFGRTLSHSMA